MSNQMIYRNGGTTVVEAAAMQSPEDLAYAMGFLANHLLYKMSKGGGGVTKENAQAVADAFGEAAGRFHVEITDRLDPEEMEGTISNLGLGKVVNPYQFVN